MEWRELRGEGEVRAFTVIHVPPTSMVGKVPYAIGLVKLDEGPTLTARILGDEKDISVGTRVVAEFKKEGEKTVLFFKPLGATSL